MASAPESWSGDLNPHKQDSIPSNRLTYLSSLRPEKLAREIKVGKEVVTRIEFVYPNNLVRDPLYNSDYALKWGRQILDQGQLLNLHAAGTINRKGEFVREVTDGIHRANGVEAAARERHLEPPLIRVETVYGLTREQIIIAKIEATTDLAGVKMARVAIWMRELWDQSPFAKVVSLKQAFGIVHNDKETSFLVKDATLRERIKEWVRDNAGRFAKRVDQIYRYLLIVDIASPHLIARVRSGSFTEGGLAITFSQLKTIAEAFPNNFSVQEQIAMEANAHSISGKGLERIIDKLKKASSPTKDDIVKAIKDDKQEFGDAKSRNPRQTLLREVASLGKRARIRDLDSSAQTYIQHHLNLITRALAEPGSVRPPTREVVEGSKKPLDSKIATLVDMAFSTQSSQRKKALEAFSTLDLAEIEIGQINLLFDTILGKARGMENQSRAVTTPMIPDIIALADALEGLRSLAPDKWDYLLAIYSLHLKNINPNSRLQILRWAREKSKPFNSEAIRLPITQ